METNKNFFQIILSTNVEQDLRLPPLLEEASLHSQGCLPGFSYKRWNNDSLRELIKTFFSKDVVDAYDSLVPLAYKSDLGRYCLLYQYGGWYADISLKIVTKAISGVVVEGLNFFRDYGAGLPSPMVNTFDIMNAFMCSQSKHPALEQCIIQIVRNVKAKYYGFSSVSPTGPRLLGRILAAYELGMVRQIGHFMPLTQGFKQRNLAYVANSGEIFAWHKTTWHPSHPGGGNLADVGLQGTNNYNELWRARKVYR